MSRIDEDDKAEGVGEDVLIMRGRQHVYTEYKVMRPRCEELDSEEERRRGGLLRASL